MLQSGTFALRLKRLCLSTPRPKPDTPNIPRGFRAPVSEVFGFRRVEAKSIQRRKRIAKAIRLVWASLDSHLDASTEEEKNKCESCGSRQFHSRTNKEYAFILSVLCDEMR